MYLIMKCEPLGDQWECDADRSPITLTEDWMKWYQATKPDYDFEVYAYVNNTFQCVKSYEAPMEEGMVYAYYDDNENPVVIQKFPNRTRNDKVPKSILKRARKGEEYDDSLRNCGHISWIEGDILYCYTEYSDSHISTPY